MNADNSSYIRELKRAEQKEKDYLRKRAKRKTTLLNALAEDRVPKEIQSKLNEAFCKAFQVIFDRVITDKSNFFFFMRWPPSYLSRQNPLR